MRLNLNLRLKTAHCNVVQIFKYCPNHTSMEILFIQMMNTSQFHKNDHYDCFLCSRVTYYVQKRVKIKLQSKNKNKA